LKAEFTKIRVRRGCATVEELKKALLREKREADGGSDFIYPRWVRINNIRSTLEDQLSTTFLSYKRVDTLAELATDDDDRNSRKLLYMDPNIPDLVAVPYGADFTSSPAYKNGEIILQDKASCFPAYLLLGDRGPQDAWEGDLVDGCAAPGNKTTHMASLLAKQQKGKKARKQIFSMDASKVRSKTLQKMVSLAGADPTVTVLQGQDFLALDPMDEQFENVTGLLLDPSCSGSGIVGRDDVPQFTLPVSKASQPSKSQGKKRKRRADEDEDEKKQPKVAAAASETSPSDENDIPAGAVDNERLTKLSNLQARIVEHAMKFSNATHVTYSTCSIHLIENEAVVARLLASEVAQQRGWRLLRRDEQPEGLRKWKHRGVRRDRDAETGVESEENAVVASLSEEDLEACLRCWSGDAEGLGGFFVAGFVRDSQSDTIGEAAEPIHEDGDKSDDGWEGFSD
jgi:putative methyltransferase